jgi:N-acetylglucosamine-6-phosphate deacetylase
MNGLLLSNARVVCPDSVIQPGWVAISDGRIAAVGPGHPEAALADGREVIDANGATLLPGFIDVHVHGAVGHEVMDATVDGLTAMSRFFATRGVTSFLATTWTAGEVETLAALGSVADTSDCPLPGAQILGAHMEGPYLSTAKCGAQDPRFIRPPDLDEARRFLASGPVRMMTLAPELARARELVDLCLEHGVRVSVGHTEASYEQVVAAAEWGARHVTHTFNAMPPLHHRAPGPVGAAIMLPELLAELIADNHHVHPAVLAGFLRAKTAEGVVLVTDALRPTGLEMGEFTIGGRPSTVSDGVVRLADGTLAGSVLTMDVALRNLAHANAVTPESLWRTASRNGAVAAGVEDRKGVIAPGMDADLVLVDRDVDVLLTVVGGRIVHRAADDRVASRQ